MSLKEKFEKLEPDKKKLVIWMFLGGVILLVTALGYNSRTNRTLLAPDVNQDKEIVLDRDLIEKTMLKEQRRQIDMLQKAVAKLQKQRNEPHSSSFTGEGVESPDTKENDFRIPTPEELIERQEASRKAKENVAGLEEPDSEEYPMAYPPPPPGSQQQQIKIIGDIGILSNAAAAEDDDSDKKKARSVYLPPSFMEAQLLTGFDASTSGRGKNNPEPLLLRIQTPAVLPNDVKAGLAGCFVIAEAVGRLDKERADVRLVSLSCLTDKGKAIIDTPVKGFVTDSDSKVGLAGRVVSKMGASTARAVVAGFFGGMGEMFREASTTRSTSAFGSISTINSDDVAQYGIGGGLAEGADTLREFYLDLAKQATPVIEVGAAKKITVIVSEGKELEIRDIPNEDF